MCLPPVDGSLLSPFSLILIPTFQPEFLEMLTVSIAKRLGERFLLSNKPRNYYRAPIFFAAAHVCEHIYSDSDRGPVRTPLSLAMCFLLVIMILVIIRSLKLDVL